MNFLPSNKVSLSYVLNAKEAVERRSPWLVALCFTILPVILVIISVFTTKLFFQLLQKDEITNVNAIAIVEQNRLNDGVDLHSNTIKRFAEKIYNTSKEFTLVVKETDSLHAIFERLGVSGEIAKSILVLDQAKPLKKLKEGRQISLLLGPSKSKLKRLVYEIGELDTLVITATKEGWNVGTKHIEPVAKVRYFASVISDSIYLAAKKAGISPKITMQFANIFSNQVNANRIRSGDKFALFYNQYVANGKRIRDGDILAAELIHRGKTYRVIGYTYPDGKTRFYTPDGHGVEQAINRYPLKYRRVASRFSKSRRHPILKIIRPHLGVDFAANYGTPVKATSDGRISYAGRKGAYGKTIIVKYGKYSSLYAHLSKFAKGARSGKYVKRGQVIGYVGSTGLSTSAHLHYELRVNGVHRNPLTVKLPASGMIASEHRNSFFDFSKEMMAQLDSYREEKVLAMNSETKL